MRNRQSALWFKFFFICAIFFFRSFPCLLRNCPGNSQSASLFRRIYFEGYNPLVRWICKCMCKFSRRTHGTEHFVPIGPWFLWRHGDVCIHKLTPLCTPCPHSPSRCIGSRLGWTQPRGQVALSTNTHSEKSYTVHANTRAHNNGKNIHRLPKCYHTGSQ